ncbi:MAG: site-specific DNA-methyltransferase [Bacillota bacterium]
MNSIDNSIKQDVIPQECQPIKISYRRTCQCPEKHINCLTAKEWLKSQIGVWHFNYEARDIRDKSVHPATFPISLAKKIIELFTHKGELVLDPFVGSGTTLIAAQDLDRNSIGFDLQSQYIELCKQRLGQNFNLFTKSEQIAIQEDARNISNYIEPETISLIWTSPPYNVFLN